MREEYIAHRMTPSGLEVSIRDVELYDMIDDLLTDKGLEPEWTRVEQSGGQDVHVLHFSDPSMFKQIIDTLRGISQETIERIALLND